MAVGVAVVVAVGASADTDVGASASVEPWQLGCTKKREAMSSGTAPVVIKVYMSSSGVVLKSGNPNPPGARQRAPQCPGRCRELPNLSSIPNVSLPVPDPSRAHTHRHRG